MKNHIPNLIHRPAFTLIETVISLSIMSVLFLGLSGAVMIGSNAIPTATQTGLADQQVIDALNQFRSDLRQATTIQHVSSAQEEVITLDIKDTGAPGTPSKIRYRYQSDLNSFSRLNIGESEEVLIDNIMAFQLQFTQDGSDATVVRMTIAVNGTIQQLFEIHVALPDKPGLI